MQEVLCTICGKNEATTEDHLPPKGIYPRQDRNMKMHWVPACSSCNGEGSKADEEFKLFMGLETGGFREKQQQLLDSLAGTISHNRRLANQVFSSYHKLYARYRGPIAEKVVAIEFSTNSYHLVISRIVRGLYWRETHNPLGLEPRIKVFPAYSLDMNTACSFKELMDMLPPKKLNKGTFVYKVLSLIHI